MFSVGPGSFHSKFYPELKALSKTFHLITISSVIIAILLHISVEFGLALIIAPYPESHENILCAV